MNKRRKMILMSILSIATLFSVVATSLSWFTLMTKFNTHLTGSSITNYYGGGTGTLSDPYLIKTPKHLYNLAWLQNLGVYPTKKYFKLDNNLDMKGALKGTTSETGAVPLSARMHAPLSVNLMAMAKPFQIYGSPLKSPIGKKNQSIFLRLMLGSQLVFLVT